MTGSFRPLTDFLTTFLLFKPREQAIYGVFRCLTRAVRVPHRDTNIGMAKDFLYDFKRSPIQNEQRSEGMPNVVKANALQSRLHANSMKGFTK